MRFAGWAHLQTEWSRLLIGSFADAGVEDVVISPGSRSTPFVVAAVRHPRLRCWDVVDERSAAFFALGQARATGKPSLLLCTSGTAAANYLPAVVEAGASHTPLLVLTADRPFELADCGANQTIDQLGLYGDHARRFFDLGVADPSPHALRALRRTVAQAAFASLHPEPGAVHLNARARKPLEPRAAVSGEEKLLAETVDRLLTRALVRPSLPYAQALSTDVLELAEACLQERGLIVCGSAPISRAEDWRTVARISELTGFPVYFEPASQGRFRGPRAENEAVFADALDALLHSPEFRAAMAPGLVLQIGRPPTSKAWESYLESHPDCEHWVIAPHGWNDSRSTADRLLFADVGPTLEALEEQLAERLPERRPGAWSQTFRRLEESAWRQVDAELAAAGELSEGAVARAVAAGLPEGALFAVGNSLPIRQVDTWCPGDLASVQVWSQRGVSGIDGLISGAAGAATCWDRPTVLLIGDVSFLHDLGGLAVARRVEHPLVIVVVQNRGGRIFEQLPLAADPSIQDGFFDHWTTPHDLDFSHAAALFRLPFERVEKLAELERALQRALRHAGASVIEAMVPAGGAAEQNRRLWRRIDRRVIELIRSARGAR
ncbi:MAG: 2-succinyl-5-enolpyruvyl-6-hydroxy-3-cyclohexene-1-carboxylic-acid synthase [Thermoanaerobaculia bacterium]